MAETLVPLTAALVMIMIVPGPNVVAVVASSMRDRRAGLWTAVGVSTGDLLWATAALAGLGTVLERSQQALAVLRWVGAAYLVVLAITLWRDGGRRTDEDQPPPRAVRRPFVNGVLVDLANPKAAVFFTSLYASLLPAELGLGPAGVILTTTAVILFGWYGLLALLLSQPPAQRFYQRARRLLTRVSAGAMGALGARVALSD